MDELNDHVIVTLIDFKLNNRHSNNTNLKQKYNDEDNSLIVKELFGWLRNMFKKPRIVPFSYNFNESASIDLTNEEDYVDIKISYRYNCIIVFTYENFQMFDKNSYVLLNEITFRGALVSVMDESKDELFMIYTDHDEQPTTSRIVLFNLGKLLRCDKWQDCVIWNERTDVNAFGLDIYKTSTHRYLVAIDNFTDYLTFFNCENGNVESFTPKIKSGGYSLLVIENKELIIPYDDEIIMYQFEEDTNQSVPSIKIIKSKIFPKPSKFYALVYDSANQNIIITNTLTNEVMVLRRSDLEIVLEYSFLYEISGLCLNDTNGELLMSFSKQMKIFK